MRFIIFSYSPSKQIYDSTSKQPTPASCYILSNSLFNKNSTIWHCIVWDSMYENKNWKEYRTKRSWLILKSFPSTAGYLAHALQCRNRGESLSEKEVRTESAYTRDYYKKVFWARTQYAQSNITTIRPLKLIRQVDGVINKNCKLVCLSTVERFVNMNCKLIGLST